MKKIFDGKINRRDFLKAAGIGALGAAALGVPGIKGVSSSAAPLRLKFVTHEPANSLANKAHWLWWCDRVEQLSNGAVKFDKFPGEALVKASEMYEACRDGVVQAGDFPPAFEAGNIPLSTIKELPFLYSDLNTLHAMWQKFMEAGFNDYFNSFGIHIVSDMNIDPFVFYSSKKWGPIRRIEDLKGCKVRVPGGDISLAIKAMGGIPVSIPSPEIYTAMERGTVDAVSTYESALISFRAYEVSKYVTRANWIGPCLPVMVNLKTWKSLPKNMQGIFLQAGEDAYNNLNKEVKIFLEKTVEPTIQKAGMEVVPLPASERERMKKACAPVWDNWLAKNGATFNGLGKKLFDIVVTMVGRP
ncbi:MAG TPA: TRAP transporter substrate-binding protein [Syntrophorhabdaceae bacterium]|nr:TRAP transporter substrate-binding protein [Syntrophorhabdaceae bacterium]HOE15931.1 TRAP transporter substrate-binding protein [Syntrophorhabdaceae bacterium]HQM80227.1 TRAP transporter substrate-binding protein [Syntrophorhabdaceae bacterium]HQM80230.1 TRAP transporter substrate-binding protein [Syntrophorhabdaceae bacterium]